MHLHGGRALVAGLSKIPRENDRSGREGRYLCIGAGVVEEISVRGEANM